MASHLNSHHIDMFSAPCETDVKGRAMQPIQAILFDMDGTLVDSERVSQAAWKLAAHDLGFELPDALTQSFIGRTAPSVHALVAITCMEMRLSPRSASACITCILIAFARRTSR